MDVLNEALRNHPKPEIFNTDQGSQYTSFIHTQTLKDNGIQISMDSKGRVTDNIAIERFWRTVKCERIYLNEYNSIKELKRDVARYIYFYNYYRFHPCALHSLWETLDYKCPMEVYNKEQYELIINQGKSINKINTYKRVAYNAKFIKKFQFLSWLLG